jgi:hypothetical protein
LLNDIVIDDEKYKLRIGEIVDNIDLISYEKGNDNIGVC